MISVAPVLKTRTPPYERASDTSPAPTPTGTPVDVNLIQGNTRQHHGTSVHRRAPGLLLRRQIITRTPLNGSLTETVDYGIQARGLA